jgi:hypothetical protein
MELTMKRPVKVFEPITKPLIKSLHFQGRKHGLSQDEVYRLVADMTGIPSLTSLSKQEALFLVGTITGQSVRSGPLPPPWENDVEGGDALPSYYHIRDIRLMFKELGWNKENVKGWLEKWFKVEDIRAMDRKQAQKALYALGKIVERKQGSTAEQNG